MYRTVSVDEATVAAGYSVGSGRWKRVCNRYPVVRNTHKVISRDFSS